MREIDELDRLLDSALGTYAEPRRGIEQRILARVNEMEAARLAPRRRWLVWTVAIPAVCILLYTVIPGIRKNHANIEEHAARQVQPSLPATNGSQRVPIPTSAKPRPLRGSIKPAATVAAAPKLDVFPAPRPLSTEEQALIALAKQGPELQREALARQKQEDVPLQISAIQIPPISPPDEGER
jgi:hypothetical protein